MKNKLIIAITGASGSIYAKGILDKLVQYPDQYEAVGIVMSKNAKDVWETELGNQSYTKYPFSFPALKPLSENFYRKYTTLFIN